MARYSQNSGILFCSSVKHSRRFPQFMRKAESSFHVMSLTLPVPSNVSSTVMLWMQTATPSAVICTSVSIAHCLRIPDIQIPAGNCRGQAVVTPGDLCSEYGRCRIFSNKKSPVAYCKIVVYNNYIVLKIKFLLIL